MTHARVGVVIPFFQREPGILLRALRSVLAQVGAPHWHVWVVDDGSPVPAVTELELLPAQHRSRFTLITQRNAGPGSARNRGLDALPATVEYVAFLDSDDLWSADHLARATAALGLGYDFYFADYMPLGEKRSSFSYQGFDAEGYSPCAGDDSVRRFCGAFFDLVLKRSPVGTPTVVFRREIYDGMRFPEDLRRAGEDHIFWLRVAAQRRPTCFSTQVEVFCGAGVNIYEQAGWGTSQGLARTLDDVRFHRAVLREFDLSQAQARTIHRKLRGLRRAAATQLVHRMRRHGAIDWRGALTLLRREPACVVDWPAAMLEGVLAKRRRGI